MKTLIKSAIIGLALAGLAQAVPSTNTQNSTWNLTTSAQTFTFNKFNSTLGTLTAVDLIFNSASLGGGITLQSVTSPRTITGFSSYISVSGTGINTTADTTAYTGIATTGTKSGIPTTGRTFTVNATQSAISGPETLSLLDNAPTYSSFIGGGTFNFSSLLAVDPTGTGTNITNINTTGDTLSSIAGVTLRYTYTPSDPSAVPEPGQVAASLLLLGGIGGYVFNKRRRKTSTAAA
jgi:hypothetical protein